MGNLVEQIKSFKNKHIMVIGDIIADEFIIGEPERLSREAPVLILKHQAREVLPGGCANAASNIRSLGGIVEIVGVVGEDEPGKFLCNSLQKRGINTDELIVCPQRPTSVKTRVIAGGNQIVKQQVIRIDYLDDSTIEPQIEKKILDHLRELVNKIDGIVLSDYGLGIFSNNLKREIVEIIHNYDIPIVVDSRYNLLDFQGVTILTPNLEEASKALGYSLRTREDVIKGGKELLLRLSSEFLLITQGGDGMTVFTTEGEYKHFPVVNYSEVYDVTGAGDTVVSIISLALCSGVDIFSTVALANYAAGIVVRKAGVATVSSAELIEEVKRNDRKGH